VGEEEVDAEEELALSDSIFSERSKAKQSLIIV
jgi:hypothetical protein